MDVPVSQVSKALAIEHIALHVLVVTLCDDSNPLGCIPEVDNLRVVAEATGGSLEVLTSSIAADLDSFGQIFIRPFYAREDNFTIADPSLRLKESRLQGYQLEGATLEHILAARLTEGFKMTNISLESASRNKGMSLPQYQKTSPTSFVTIRLEKRYNTISSLVYFVSFRTNSPNQGLEEHRSSSSVAKLYVYTKGILSIDIVWISPDRVVASASVDGSVGMGILVDARVISENDKSMAGLLGMNGMPGCVLAAPQPTKGNALTASSYAYAAVVQQLVANADLVEDICRLNCVCKTTMYLRAFFVLTTITSNAKCRSTIFASIKETLPAAKFSQLDTLKWLCVVPLSHKEVGAAAADKSNAEQEQYEVLVVEVKQSVSVFIEVSISLLGNGSGVNVMNVKMISDAVQSALGSLSFDPLLLRRDLSMIASSNPQSGRSQFLAMCHLQNKTHFLPMDLSQRFLMESLVSEVCRNKIALGFQVATCTGEDLVELCLCAVIAACPSGIECDSLLQCKVECSEEGVMTTYSWEPTCQVREYRKPRVTVGKDHGFVNSKEVLMPLAEVSTVGAAVPAPPLPMLSSKNCASMLVSLVDMLMQQNLRTYEFYDALTCIYPVNIKGGPGPGQRHMGATGASRQAVPPLKVSWKKWNCLKNYSYQRKMYMPSFSDGLYSAAYQLGAPSDNASQCDTDIGKSMADLAGPDIVRSLIRLLKESLVRILQLVEFEVLEYPDNCALGDEGRKPSTFCVAVPEGLIVIEVDPKEENYTVTPSRRISSEQIYLEQNSWDVLSGDNYDDFDDLVSPEHNYYSLDEKSEHATEQQEKSEHATEGQGPEISATTSIAESDDNILVGEGLQRQRSFVTAVSDVSTAKLRIDFHFISIPMNTLFSNTELTDMAQNCIVDTNISKLKDKNDAHTKHGLAQAAKSRMIEINEAILQFHRCNFSLVLYSGIRNGEILHVDNADLDMALSHCTSDIIELDLTNLSATKRAVYEGKSASTSSADGMLPSPELFQYTIGKYLKPIQDSSCFLFAPTSDVFNLPKHDNIYSMAVFVNIYVIRKPVSAEGSSEAPTEIIQVPNDPNGLSDVLFDIYSKKNDDFVDDNTTVRVECLTSSIGCTEQEMKQGSKYDISETFYGGHDRERDRERGISDLQSAIGTPGAFTIGPGVNEFYHSSVMRRLTYELESLITYDTLYTLLLMPVVTKGTIVLVQHCLRSIKGLTEKIHSMDFVVPASSHVPSFSDLVNGFFDQELQECPMFNQIGE
jgi:hypothetical protein